jgi:hypothetical protein
MTQEHSNYCHCVCTDLIDLQSAIEMARAIHIKHEPNDKPCLVCDTVDGSCDNCRWIKDCVVCAEAWPCDTFIALDYEAS